TPVPQLFRGKTCIVEVVPANKLSGTIPTRLPCQRGKRVDDHLKIAFASAQSLLGALPVFDIRDQNVPTNKAPDAVTRWKRAHLKPSVDSIETSKTRLVLERFL